MSSRRGARDSSEQVDKTLEELFAEQLKAGCGIFGMSCGAIMAFEDGELHVRKQHRDQCLPPGELNARVLSTRRTCLIRSQKGEESTCIGTPIFLQGQFHGSIAFWSQTQPGAALHPRAGQIIELMASSIGIAIFQREVSAQLAFQAMHDALTGLPNRLFMKERLDEALEQALRDGAHVAVVFIDLDRFKEINASLGHGIGDGVLQQVARRLQASMTPGDTLARMGGDEFTAIFRNFGGRQEAPARARRLLHEVRTPSLVEKYELFVTGSIGVSFFPHDGTDAATLLRNADAAMYIAKASGNNEVHCFDVEMTAGALERLELETSMRRALERYEFELQFQPQVDSTGAIAAVEVLLTWEHPELGRLPPGRFIPIAEVTGMIVPIGSWVLRQACSLMAAWVRRGLHGVCISVNVSALQFTRGSFVNTVQEALATSGLPAGCLELELTESLIMRDVDHSAGIMQALSDLGVKIAIDDFGTGYSSLSYLRRLPAHTLKIDRSFIQAVDTPKGAALVETIVTLGHALGLTVTAEGVETIAQMELLRHAGCNRMQGHLIGLATTADSLEQMLFSEWRWAAVPVA